MCVLQGLLYLTCTTAAHRKDVFRRGPRRGDASRHRLQPDVLSFACLTQVNRFGIIGHCSRLAQIAGKLKGSRKSLTEMIESYGNNIEIIRLPIKEWILTLRVVRNAADCFDGVGALFEPRHDPRLRETRALFGWNRGGVAHLHLDAAPVAGAHTHRRCLLGAGFDDRRRLA